MADSPRVSASLRSGLTGGAATGSGVDYQTLYAVLTALKLMLRLFTESPTQRPILSIEPRLLSKTKAQLTRWDIQISPDAIAIEAKANAGKQDLIEFLERCQKSVRLNLEQKFELVFGECNVGFLRAIEKLLRIAKESGNDASRFKSLCDLESDERLTEVLSHLKGVAFAVANRVNLKHAPEYSIEDDIQVQLQFLVPPSQRRHLFSELWTRFSRAMKDRTPFFVPKLITDLQQEFDFTSRQAIEPVDIFPSLHKALYFLQQCEVPVPMKVLANVSGDSETSLEQQFVSQQVAGVNSDNCWEISPLPAKLGHPNSTDLLSNGLYEILDFIQTNGSNQLGVQQVQNAVAIVRMCAELNPSAAST